ncbi:MAG: hypothetical protein IPO06_13215 [Leptospiraceae bacterium]|nr:hypothetical protein [Leptospiraceae bacterium]
MLDLSISDFSVLGFGGLFCLVWAAGLSLQLPIRTKFIAFRQSGEGALAIQLLPEKIRIFSITLLIYILIMIIADILGYVLGNKFLYRYSAWSHSFAAILVYLYSRLNPYSMLEISGAIKTARYSRSKLVNLDSNEAILKLNNLMGNESYSIRRKIWTH